MKSFLRYIFFVLALLASSAFGMDSKARQDGGISREEVALALHDLRALS